MATGTEANIVPDRELENRTKRVQKAVREMDIDALFLVQRVDFYYLTGIMQRGIFYLPGEGVPLLFLDGSPAFGGGRLGNCETFHIASLKEIPKVIRDYYGAGNFSLARDAWMDLRVSWTRGRLNLSGNSPAWKNQPGLLRRPSNMESPS